MTEPSVVRSVERTAQLLSRQLTRRLGDRLTDLEAHVLFHLEHLPPGTRPSIRELQSAFGLRPSTLTAIVDRLERHGLVKRRPNPDDRRSLLVVPTASAKKAIRQVTEVLQTIESEVRSRATSSEMDGFMAVIRAMEDALR